MTITNPQQYQTLAWMADNAEEHLTDGFGDHQKLIALLRDEHGIIVRTREGAIAEAKNLCHEYMFSKSID